MIFQLPIAIVDVANTVIDPLFDGINTGKHWCGKYLKERLASSFMISKRIAFDILILPLHDMWYIRHSLN